MECAAGVSVRGRPVTPRLSAQFASARAGNAQTVRFRRPEPWRRHSARFSACGVVETPAEVGGSGSYAMCVVAGAIRMRRLQASAGTIIEVLWTFCECLGEGRRDAQALRSDEQDACLGAAVADIVSAVRNGTGWERTSSKPHIP